MGNHTNYCIAYLCANKNDASEYFCTKHENNLSYKTKKSEIKRFEKLNYSTTEPTEREKMIDKLESCGFNIDHMPLEEQVPILKDCLLKILRGEI